MGFIEDLSKSLKSNIDSVKFADQKPYENIPFMSEKEWKSILPPPPSNSSLSTQKDLYEIINMTSSRSKKQKNLVMRIDDDMSFLFTEELTRLNLGFPENLVNDMWDVYYSLVMNLKLFFNRARTWQLAPKYGIVIDVIISDSAQTPSYPSGHSAYAYMIAEILSEIYPIHKTKFNTIAEKVGWARKMQGVHYQSDIDASRQLTKVSYRKIKSYLAGDKDATSKSQRKRN